MWGPGRSGCTLAPGHRDDDTGLCQPGGWGAWPTTQSWANGRQPHPNLQGEMKHSYPNSSSHLELKEPLDASRESGAREDRMFLKQFFLITLVPPKQCNERHLLPNPPGAAEPRGQHGIPDKKPDSIPWLAGCLGSNASSGTSQLWDLR